MKSEYSIEKRNGYLYFVVTGAFDREEFRAYGKVIMNLCRQENIHRVLVNALSVTGTNLSTMERYVIGEAVAELFPPTIKIGIAWPEKDINRFGETVAVNRGAFTRVSGDVETAEKWLLNIG